MPMFVSKESIAFSLVLADRIPGKNALDSENNENPKDLADIEFGNYLAEMSISHELRARPEQDSNAATKEPKKTEENALDDSRAYNPKMPMLTKQGFLDLSAIEYLVNPDKALDYLRNALEEYKIWKELGEMPRIVLPNNSLPKASQIKSKATQEENSGCEDLSSMSMSAPPFPVRTSKDQDGKQVKTTKDEFHEVDLQEKESSTNAAAEVADEKEVENKIEEKQEEENLRLDFERKNSANESIVD